MLLTGLSKGGPELLHNGIIVQLWKHPNSSNFQAALIKVINHIIKAEFCDATQMYSIHHEQ